MTARRAARPWPAPCPASRCSSSDGCRHAPRPPTATGRDTLLRSCWSTCACSPQYWTTVGVTAALYAEHPLPLQACMDTVYWLPETLKGATDVALPERVAQVPPLWQYWSTGRYSWWRRPTPPRRHSAGRRTCAPAARIGRAHV